MRRCTPGRGLLFRPGQLYAVEEPSSLKLHRLSRNRRLPHASSIPARPIQMGCPTEKHIPKTGTKKNESTHRLIDNRATPREKGGLVLPLYCCSARRPVPTSPHDRRKHLVGHLRKASTRSLVIIIFNSRRVPDSGGPA